MNNNPSCRYPTPSPADQAKFLLRLYFGAGDDALARVIDRAHQDLSRTVHGIGDYPDARPQAIVELANALQHLSGNAAITTQDEFDGWHRKTCEALCSAYAAAGYARFTVGQAQKWLNMTLKYVFVFGEAYLPGYAGFYRFCHVPIDNILLDTRAFAGLNSFKERWSRIVDYEDYLAFQFAVRERFPEWAPLAVEFWAWQGHDAP